jgi:hypothetical protein
MEKDFSIANLFPEFHSSKIDTGELEKIIKDAVRRDNPFDAIKKVDYTEDGVVVTLDSGQEIEIDIDWNEIILSR